MIKNLLPAIRRTGISLLIASTLGLSEIYSQWSQYNPNANAKKLVEIVKASPNLFIQRLGMYQKRMTINELGEVKVTYFDNKEIGTIGKGDDLRVVIQDFWGEKKCFNDYNLNGMVLENIRSGDDVASIPNKDYEEYKNGLLLYEMNISNIMGFYNDSYNETLGKIIKFLESSK